MTTLPISSMAASAPATPTPSSSSVTSAASTSNLANQSVFLQLLVAQLKNQDPEQPTDGTAFVTELAQFTTVQEDTTSATDLNTIVAALPTLTAPTAPTTPTTPAAPTGTTAVSTQ